MVPLTHPRASAQSTRTWGGDPRIPNNRWAEDGCMDQSVLRLGRDARALQMESPLHSIEMACAGLLGKDGMSIQHLQPLRFQEIDLSKAEGGRPSAAVATLTSKHDVYAVVHPREGDCLKIAGRFTHILTD